MVMVRLIIICESLVELFYYRSGFGYVNFCLYCCGEGEVNKEFL